MTFRGGSAFDVFICICRHLVATESKKAEFIKRKEGGMGGALSEPFEGEKVKLPMPATTFFISAALKKMRVQSMSDINFKKCELWRGMKNLTSSEEFVRMGGECSFRSINRDCQFCMFVGILHATCSHHVYAAQCNRCRGSLHVYHH